MIVGLCRHGLVVAGLHDEEASEDAKIEFAMAYRLERRDLCVMDGCEECTQQYLDNCELLGIAP